MFYKPRNMLMKDSLNDILNYASFYDCEHMVKQHNDPKSTYI